MGFTSGGMVALLWLSVVSLLLSLLSLPASLALSSALSSLSLTTSSSEIRTAEGVRTHTGAKNIQYHPPHLTFYFFAPSRTAVFNFEVPSGKEIMKIPAEIDTIEMAPV